MLYSVTINQKKAIQLDLNINQSFILSVLSLAPLWAEVKHIDNQTYFWISRHKIIDELPLLALKADTVQRHLKALEKKGIIKYYFHNKMDLFYFTDLGKTYFSAQNSEVNPTKLGSKSDKNSEVNPTYNNTKSNNTTNHHNTGGDEKKIVKSKVLKEHHKYSEYFEEIWKSITYIKKGSKPMASKRFEARLLSYKTETEKTQFYQDIELIIQIENQKSSYHRHFTTLLGDTVDIRDEVSRYINNKHHKETQQYKHNAQGDY